MDSLVSTEWLEAELGAPDLRVIDATLFLPGTGRDARAEYEAAHIPGAVFFDIEEISDRDSPLPHMLPPDAQVRQPDAVARARRRQPLRRLRQQPAAQRGAGLVDAEDLRRPSCRPARRRPAEMEGGGAAAGERAASRTGTAISPPCLDARRGGRQGGGARPDRTGPRDRRRAAGARASPARTPEPRPGVASGHIPGSRNAPQSDFFNADNSWKQGDGAARRVRRGRRRSRQADGDDLRLGRDRRR